MPPRRSQAARKTSVRWLKARALPLEERRSNYDITRDRVEGEFPQYDQESVIEKFRLAHDGDYIYLRFAAQDYRISRGTGRVERMPEAVHAGG